ncbi:hypothetical protein GCM10022403_078800 [Streptomyces coacervatus]|uniref:Uncharacterized protein n=1 Tax=Streptomyces coacervatus TaxID=647381 RepID=A0ABP7J3V3_9ACTN|nr:hypothetical protein [Streptomyces coacervatus]MDF2269275.1 hypothetical protein [Streptomyces coacervatus]
MSTAIGGLIALGSSFLVDRHRSRRDRELHKRSELRSAYAAFLQATTEASEILWNISQGHDNDETARARALTVLRDSSVLARRFELSLVTNDEMTASTSQLIKLLIAYRDAVGRGIPYNDEELSRPRKEFNHERERLIRVMRETL